MTAFKLSLRIKVVGTGGINITEMAKEMIPTQMSIQLIPIQIPFVTIFT